MNDTFKPRRFGYYFAWAIRSEYKKYAMAIGVTLGIMLIFMLTPILTEDSVQYEYTQNESFYSHIDPMYDMLATIFGLGIFAVTIIAASLTFSNLSNKDDRVSSLMLPASQLEKYLTRWIIYIPVALLAFLLTFEAADLLRCLVTHIKAPESNIIRPFLNDNLTDWWEYGPLSFVILFQGIYMLGSAVWPKLSLLKTSLAVFAIGAAIVILAIWLTSVLYDPDMHYGFSDEWDEAGGTEIHLLMCANYLVALICWVIAYFRIKEIEIIQCW